MSLGDANVADGMSTNSALMTKQRIVELLDFLAVSDRSSIFVTFFLVAL